MNQHREQLAILIKNVQDDIRNVILNMPGRKDTLRSEIWDKYQALLRLEINLKTALHETL